MVADIAAGICSDNRTNTDIIRSIIDKVIDKTQYLNQSQFLRDHLLTALVKADKDDTTVIILLWQ